MSNNTITIALLKLDWSNITLFEPMSPIKMAYSTANKTALWLDDITDLLLTSKTYLTLRIPVPVQGEMKRQDLTATATREQPKLQALRLIAYVFLGSNLRLQLVQTLHFGCPNPLLSIPLHLPHTHTDTRLVYCINSGHFTSCLRQNDSSEECDKVRAGLTV